jgi:hypothetical protein
MAKKKRTKYVPTFVHECDDFVLADGDGNEFYPHAGETVTFRQDLPWRLMTIPWRLMTISADMENEAYMLAVIRVLKRQIRDWTWTDDEGEPLPSPAKEPAGITDEGEPWPSDPEGFDDALWDISAIEREYLRAHCWDSARLGEA